MSPLLFPGYQTLSKNFLLERFWYPGYRHLRLFCKQSEFSFAINGTHVMLVRKSREWKEIFPCQSGIAMGEYFAPSQTSIKNDPLDLFSSVETVVWYCKNRITMLPRSAGVVTGRVVLSSIQAKVKVIVFRAFLQTNHYRTTKSSF